MPINMAEFSKDSAERLVIRGILGKKLLDLPQLEIFIADRLDRLVNWSRLIPNAAQFRLPPPSSEIHPGKKSNGAAHRRFRLPAVYFTW